MTPATACARLFHRPEADTVLRYLKHRTLDRALPPDATDAELRFLEGQRALVLQLIALIQQGEQQAQL